MGATGLAGREGPIAARRCTPPGDTHVPQWQVSWLAIVLRTSPSRLIQWRYEVRKIAHSCGGSAGIGLSLNRLPFRSLNLVVSEPLGGSYSIYVARYGQWKRNLTDRHMENGGFCAATGEAQPVILPPVARG